MNDNPFTIPAEILEAATKIGVWAKKNNFKDWILMDVCDRSFADREKSVDSQDNS